MIKAAGLFLLLLLKILGWILLVLLLLLIAVLLLVLFVPVRYDVRVQNGRGTKPGKNHPAENLRLQLQVTWLLHLLHVTVSYGPKGMHNQIRAAGLDIPKMLAYFARRKESRQKRREESRRKRREAERSGSSGKKAGSRRKEEAAAGQNTDGQQQEEEGSGISHIEAEAGQPLGKSVETDGRAEASVSENPPADDRKAGQSAEKSPETTTEAPKAHRKKRSKRQKAGKTTKPKAEKRRHKPEKEGPGIFEKIRTQLGRLHKEITDEANRHAAGCLWKELLKLLQSYKPRRLKADLAFSLADPALTGEVTGVISLLPLIYRYPCSIVPDFTSEKLYLEGEIQAGGKVTAAVFVLSLLRLLRDKTFMRAVRRLLKQSRA